MVVGLEPLECLRLCLKYLASGGKTLVNTRPFIPVDVSAGRAGYPEISAILDGIRMLGGIPISLDATAIAERLGSSRMMNIVLLGGMMALGVLDIDSQMLLAQMDRRWRGEVAQANRVAFQEGFALVSQMQLAA